MKSFLLCCCMLITVSGFAQGSGNIFVVRHAEKESDAPDTPLSDKGRSRAACLAQTLKDAHISAVLTSQYIRTKQTAAPITELAHAHAESFDAKAALQIAAAAQEAAKSGNVLIVGHSNTIPQLMSALGAPSVSIPDSSFDQLFIVNASEPKQMAIVHYCPALPAENVTHPQSSMAK